MLRNPCTRSSWGCITFCVQSKVTSNFWNLVVFVQSSALGSLADVETRVLKGLERTASGPWFIIIRSTFIWVSATLSSHMYLNSCVLEQVSQESWSDCRWPGCSSWFSHHQVSQLPVLKHLHDLWYCRDSAWDLCLDIVYKVCSQMLFDFLNIIAQGMQLDCTTLELPKVRSNSPLAWSPKIWDLTLNADLMIESAL